MVGRQCQQHGIRLDHQMAEVRRRSLATVDERQIRLARKQRLQLQWRLDLPQVKVDLWMRRVEYSDRLADYGEGRNDRIEANAQASSLTIGDRLRTARRAVKVEQA